MPESKLTSPLSMLLTLVSCCLMNIYIYMYNIYIIYIYNIYIIYIYILYIYIYICSCSSCHVKYVQTFESILFYVWVKKSFLPSDFRILIWCEINKVKKESDPASKNLSYQFYQELLNGLWLTPYKTVGYIKKISKPGGLMAWINPQNTYFSRLGNWGNLNIKFFFCLRSFSIKF